MPNGEATSLLFLAQQAALSNSPEVWDLLSQYEAARAKVLAAPAYLSKLDAKYEEILGLLGVIDVAYELN